MRASVIERLSENRGFEKHFARLLHRRGLGLLRWAQEFLTSYEANGSISVWHSFLLMGFVD